MFLERKERGLERRVRERVKEKGKKWVRRIEEVRDKRSEW